jgi:tRNA-dihydrouridine synthase B
VKRCKVPVTVKTRLGWDEQNIRILEVVERLQDVGVQAITIHARTRYQMYKGEADWTWISRVKDMPNLRIPVFGNGDIDSPEKAIEYKNKYGADGIMIGRAAIGYPWIFNEIKHFRNTGTHLPKPDMAERVRVCKEHLKRSVEWKGDKTGIFEMRMHYTNYFRGIPDFKPYRQKLVEGANYEQVCEVLDEIASVFQFSY